MRVLPLTLSIVAVACTRPAPSSSATGANAQSAAPSPDAAVVPQPDAAVSPAGPSTRTDCVSDPAAEIACRARGAAFGYGPRPFIYCSGVAADTRALAQQHAHAQQDQPCACINLRGLEQERAQCGMVPSRPGR